MEEALGYRTLMEQYGMTQEEAARAVNKSRPAVANALRLLNLPEELAEMVRDGKISAGHARTLLSFETAEEQAEAAQAVIKQDLSVRALEKMAKASRSTKRPERAIRHRDSLFDEVEIVLTEQLGRKVRVLDKGEGGLLQLEFYSKDDLTALCNQVAPQQ